MADYIEKLKILEEIHGIELCIYENLKERWKVWRIIENESDRALPIPKEVLADLNSLLLEECWSKPGKIARLKSWFTGKKAARRFPIDISLTGLTFEEAENLQRQESGYYKLLNSCH